MGINLEKVEIDGFVERDSKLQGSGTKVMISRNVRLRRHELEKGTASLWKSYQTCLRR